MLNQVKTKFTVRPRYALGVETKAITEFEAYAIEFGKSAVNLVMEISL